MPGGRERKFLPHGLKPSSPLHDPVTLAALPAAQASSLKLVYPHDRALTNPPAKESAAARARQPTASNHTTATRALPPTEPNVPQYPQATDSSGSATTKRCASRPRSPSCPSESTLCTRGSSESTPLLSGRGVSGRGTLSGGRGFRRRGTSLRCLRSISVAGERTWNESMSEDVGTSGLCQQSSLDLHQHPQLPSLPAVSQSLASSSSSRLPNAAKRSDLPSDLSLNLPLLLPTSSEPPSSPESPTRAWSDGEGYETPLTSPEASPARSKPRSCLLQVDGGRESIDDDPISPLTPSRHPSLLLKHCERNATPRQRRLMCRGLTSPDRFIASRIATPTKEGFILTETGNAGKSRTESDPFAPTIRRTVRMAEQYATLRVPAPPIRPVGATGTRVRQAQDSVYRTPSRGTVWTVGGTAVTKGVPSTTNGRGGRVTSGTSAPHYGADFLRRRSQTDEQATHGRRLAHALDISQAGRMVDRSSPVTSPISLRRGGIDETARVRWRDGKWERPVERTRLRSGH